MSAFIQNAWYMVGWAEELGEALLGRRIAGRRLLLLRDAEGEAVVLDDRCPHRFAPLTMGTRNGDTVACPYHGLTFNLKGECVRNPFADKAPAAARVRAYPVVERDGIVWAWLGEASAADTADVPDFGVLAETPMSKTLRGYMPMKADYESGTDNLLDLSHIEFVHKGSFAGQGVIFAGKHEFRQDGETIWSNWWMPGVKAPGHTVGVYPPDMITDHWLDMRWNAPASMHLAIGATPVGQPRDAGLIVHQAHILTPESESATHYFWATTYATPPGAPDMGGMVRSLMEQAFVQEDKPIIEAAFANLDGEDFWARKPVLLGIDAAAVRARRLIASRLERERLNHAAE